MPNSAPPNMSRTRLESNERFDLPDFNSLQELVDEAVQRQLAPLMGMGGGLATAMNLTLSDDGVTYWVSPSTFQYYWCFKDPVAAGEVDYRSFRSGFGLFDRSNPNQVLKFDYTAVRADAAAGDAVNAYPFLYVQPKLLDGDSDGRRKHVGGAEQSAVVKTRRLLVTTYKWSALAPSNASNNGWAPIAKITSWANGLVNPPGAPSFTLIPFWDSESASAEALTDPSWWSNSNRLATYRGLNAITLGATDPNWQDIDGSKSLAKTFGLIDMLTQVRARFRRHLDAAGTGALRWFDDPGRDLTTMDIALLLAETSLATLQADIDAGPRPWASAYIIWDGATYTVAAAGMTAGKPTRIVGITPTVPGRVYVQVDAPPAGWRLASVAVYMAPNVSYDHYASGQADNGIVPGTYGASVGIISSSTLTWSNASFYLTLFISKD